MAGNTKLIGFGIKGMVTLARWGGEANVELSEESITALRQACHEGLPLKPPPQPVTSGTWVDYDENQGAVRLRMEPAAALQLSKLLEQNADYAELAKKLAGAHKEHLAYHDTKEPGVHEGSH